MKLILSKPLWSDKGFESLKQALRAVDLHCCKHCPPGLLDKEVVCKLNRVLFRKSNGVCAQGENTYECDEHRHDDHCTCNTETDVQVLGPTSLVVTIWGRFKGEDNVALQPSGKAE